MKISDEVVEGTSKRILRRRKKRALRKAREAPRPQREPVKHADIRKKKKRNKVDKVKRDAIRPRKGITKDGQPRR